MSWPWSQLGLPGPSGLSEVRHAYAEKLKTTHPEEDPEGFQRLHSAYQLASRMARRQMRESAAERPALNEKRPVPSQTESVSKQEDFDFEELLQDGGEKPRRSHSEEAEQDFDFEELLRGEGMPPSSREEEKQDFDFERLFAEGEAERAEARRRRGEERRRAQTQQFQERRRQWTRREERLKGQFHQEEERWQGTETILHTIELLYNAQAGEQEWKKFFQSPLFQQNKWSIDLIFGLEDFVSARNLPQEVRLALFLAYGFDKGVTRPELRPLYQMLRSSWKKKTRESDRRWAKALFFGLLTFFGGIAGIILLVMLSTGSALPVGMTVQLYILGAGVILWVLWQVVKTGSMTKRAKGERVSRKQELRTLAGFASAVIALVLLRSMQDWDFQELLQKVMPASDPREQVCRYIEKDFGVEVASLYNRYPVEENGNVFYLSPDMSKVFLAGPAGDRDKKNGKPGYTTNFPEMMLLWELKQFASEHNLAPVNSLDHGLGREETSGTFLITLPETAGEAVIEDLGSLLEELSEEKWYQSLPPQCQLVMCSREMEEGRIVLIRVHPATEVYSVSQIRGLYEDGFAHTVYAQLLKELELDRDFLQEEEERYTLTNEGMAQIKGAECCKIFGLDKNGTVAMEYYMDTGTNNIYCVPGDFWETGNSEEQISFYRLLHREGNLGTYHLFFPWFTVS